MTDRALPDGSRDVRRWPSDPSQLVDTSRCPACFSPLVGAQCRVCGLDLAVPASVELLALSTRVRDAELERQAFITGMRAAQAARAHEAPTPDAGGQVASAPAPPVAPGVPPIATPTVAASPVAAPPAPYTLPASIAEDPAAPARVPGRSGVQVLLLTLGVVLISVTAVVFLFVAYFIASFEARAVIIAGASILVLGAAWLLRWRRLPGTAEGVASVAVVLLLVDVWFIRANGLFRSSELSPEAYSGFALLVVAALLTVTRIATGIRATGFAAATLLPAASFLLAASAVPDSGGTTAAWLGGLAAAVTGALSALLARRQAIERTILLCGASAGGAFALVFGAWALPDLDWNEVWSLLAAAGAWTAIVVVARRVAAARVFSIVAAGAAGIAAALAPAIGVVDQVEPGIALWLAPALAGVVTCLAAWALRTPSPLAAEARAGFLSAVGVALTASIAGAFAGIAGIGWRLMASVPPWADRSGDAGGPPAELEVGAILVPVVVALGSTAALVLLRGLRRFAAIPVGAAASAALAAAGVVAETGIAVAILVALAGAALAVAATTTVRRVPGLLPTLAVFGIAAAGFAWWIGFADAAVWPWAMLAALALVIGGRILAPRIWAAGAVSVSSAMHVVVGVVIAVLILSSLAPWLAAIDASPTEPWSDPWMWLGSGAALLLAVALFAPPLTLVDRISATLPLLVAGVTASLAVAVGTDATLAWLPAGSIALIGLAGLRTAPPAIRLALAATTPPLLAVSLTAAFAEAGLSVELVAPAAAALLAAALGHLVLTRETSATRITWVVSVLVSSLVALVVGWAIDERWLVLLVLTPVPLLLAALEGDPVRADRPSRHLAWASLPLVVGAAWTWLAGEAVDDVEAYTLPLAAALGLAAALITWRRAARDLRSIGRTLLIAVAAGVAVLPSVASSGESELRTLVLVAAGAVVAVAGFFLPDAARGVPARLIAVATGWVALTGASLVRGAAVSLDPVGAMPVEFWPVLALVAGVAVAIAWADTMARPTRLAEVALAASVVAASVPTLLAIVAGDVAVLRSAILFPLLAVAHIVSVAGTRRPFAGQPLGWCTLSVLVLGGVAALGLARLDPFDVVTVSIASALLGAGAVRMLRSGRVGSWPALGPGLAVLLVPALIADLTDPELWRVVALGVVAAAAVLLGAMKRMQAPLLLGSAVLLVHALWQLWPWITDIYEAVWWWLWLGIAGVLLVVLAATYERQLQLARGVVRSIAALR